MVSRAFHPIVLAGALATLPVVAAWGRSREVRSISAEPSGRPAPALVPAADGTLMMPVDVVDAGRLPVRRLVEIQTVPEPSALVLLAPSLLLVWRRRR